jgi:Fe-S-cluster-containing hydrogenase component 2
MKVRKGMKKIVRIDEAKCNGCGECTVDCEMNAIRIINGKAVVDNSLCDGLGACVGACPEGAIEIVEVEEGSAEAQQKPQHHTEAPTGLKHKHEHGHGMDNKVCGCPGSAARTLKVSPCEEKPSGGHAPSRLGNWPVQINLLPVNAPYLEDADLLIAADCVPFAYAGFHQKLLAGKILLIGCPKLDDAEFYREKLAKIFTQNRIRSVHVAYMEVPCCFGMVDLVKDAIAASGKAIPLTLSKVSIQGELCGKEMDNACVEAGL